MVFSQCASVAQRHKVLKIVFIVVLTMTSLFLTVHIMPKSLVLQWTMDNNPFAAIRVFNKTSNNFEIIDPGDTTAINSGTTVSRTGVTQPITTEKSDIPDSDSENACNFPTQDPTHPVIMKHFQKYPDIVCDDSLPDIVYRDNDILRVNVSKARALGVVFDHCNYTSLTLGETSDCIVKYSFISKKFNSSIKLPLAHEHLIVSCYRAGKKVAESYFGIIRKKPWVEKISEENYKRHIKKNSPLETLSILLVGLDGTSRQNFIRSMPRTRRYILTEMDAIEMYKFNKVGDNTFPNVIAMLAGQSQSDVLKYWLFRKPMDELDDYMLWKDYSESGYRTAMLLDSIRITSFHYAKRGWVKPPWDYYFRPLVVATKPIRKDNMHCMGDTPELTFHMDYWLQLTSLFNNTKSEPYFAYSFNQRITHADSNKATVADKLFFEFFQKINQMNVLKNTVLVFFSDHGARFGPIRQTHAGILESRTPFLFFMFPRWLQTKYPDVMKTMRTNQRRLTTMFDVHATLKDLLYFKGETGTGNLETRGISLFKEIPKERLCSHAGIPIEYCMCTKQTRSTISQEAKDSISNVLAQHIILSTQQHRKICAHLEMAETKSVVRIQGDVKCKTCAYFGVTIRMEPGGGVFEGTVIHDEKTNMKNVVGTVIRLNLYGDQANCMKDLRLKSFCFCNKSSR